MSKESKLTKHIKITLIAKEDTVAISGEKRTNRATGCQFEIR